MPESDLWGSPPALATHGYFQHEEKTVALAFSDRLWLLAIGCPRRPGGEGGSVIIRGPRRLTDWDHWRPGGISDPRAFVA